MHKVLDLFRPKFKRKRVLQDLRGNTHEVFLVRQWGIRILMLSKASNWLPVVEDGTWESGQRSFFLGELKKRNCEVCIDVGANNGIYTLLMARVPGVRRVISFEPCEPHYTLMREAAKINGFDTKCEFHPIACSNEASRKPMHVFPNDTPSLHQLEETRIKSQDDIAKLGAHVEIVETARLDDMVDLENEKIALKIDTEGHEGKVIDGATRLLKSNSCFVQVESFGEAVVSQMAELGYRRIKKIEDDHYFVPG